MLSVFFIHAPVWEVLSSSLKIPPTQSAQSTLQVFAGAYYCLLLHIIVRCLDYSSRVSPSGSKMNLTWNSPDSLYTEKVMGIMKKNLGAPGWLGR